MAKLFRPLWLLTRTRGTRFRVRGGRNAKSMPMKPRMEKIHIPRPSRPGYSGWLFVLSLLQLTAMTPIRREQKEGEDESGHAKGREHDLRGSVGSGRVAELAIEERE